MNLIQKLEEKKLINPPSWLGSNVHYLTIMGSVAYGVSSDTSDMDIYGWCMPTKELVFPHLAGEILGFGRQTKRFEQYQQHHVINPEESHVIRARRCPECESDVEPAQGIDFIGVQAPGDWWCKSCVKGFFNDQIEVDRGREYDFTVYGIVKYFQLCMENNPNMIDSLFTPANCVLHITRVGQMVRDNRRIFLHKGAWHTFKGYAYAQLSRMTKSDETQGKRRKLIDKYGYDIKFAYHIVRLLNEIEQIMMEGDLDLQKNREELKSIRRGEWTEVQIRDYFTRKEQELGALYLTSPLPHEPDEGKIKKLLLECLEEHYGNLEKCVVQPDKYKTVLQQVKDILDHADIG